jgi:hypothetical protein
VISNTPSIKKGRSSGSSACDISAAPGYATPVFRASYLWHSSLQWHQLDNCERDVATRPWTLLLPTSLSLAPSRGFFCQKKGWMAAFPTHGSNYLLGIERPSNPFGIEGRPIHRRIIRSILPLHPREDGR